MISRYLGAISYAFKFNFVNKLHSKGRIKEALVVISKLELKQKKLFEKHKIGNKALYKTKIKKGSLLFALDKFDEAIETLDKVVRDLPNCGTKYRDEKSYLLYFAERTIYASNKYGLEKKDVEKPILGNINLDNISKTTLRNFPVREHPDWHKYFPDDKSNG